MNTISLTRRIAVWLIVLISVGAMIRYGWWLQHRPVGGFHGLLGHFEPLAPGADVQNMVADRVRHMLGTLTHPVAQGDAVASWCGHMASVQASGSVDRYYEFMKQQGMQPRQELVEGVRKAWKEGKYLTPPQGWEKLDDHGVIRWKFGEVKPWEAIALDRVSAFHPAVGERVSDLYPRGIMVGMSGTPTFFKGDKRKKKTKGEKEKHTMSPLFDHGHGEPPTEDFLYISIPVVQGGQRTVMTYVLEQVQPGSWVFSQWAAITDADAKKRQSFLF